jgi:hypothetical protein
MVGSLRGAKALELVQHGGAVGVYTPLALVRRFREEEFTERLSASLQSRKGRVSADLCRLLIGLFAFPFRSFSSRCWFTFWLILVFLQIASPEMPPLRQMVKGAAKFVGIELFVESALAKLNGVAPHEDMPGIAFVRLLTRWPWAKSRQKPGIGQAFVQHPAAVSPSAQLPPRQAFLTAVLVQGSAVRVSGFGENPAAHPLPQNLTPALGAIVIDHRPTDGRWPYIEAPNARHHSLLAPTQPRVYIGICSRREVVAFRK